MNQARLMNVADDALEWHAENRMIYGKLTDASAWSGDGWWAKLNPPHCRPCHSQYLVNFEVPYNCSGPPSILLYCRISMERPSISEKTCRKPTFLPAASNSPNRASFDPSQFPVIIMQPGKALVTPHPA